MVHRSRRAIALLALVAACATGCLHTNFARFLRSAPHPGPLTIAIDDTTLHPCLGLTLALVLDVPADQRPSEADVTFALVDPETGTAARTVRKTVAFGPAGRSEDVKDVFGSRCALDPTGEPLPKGEFVLVATLRLGATDLEARQRVEVREFERVYKSGVVPRGFIPPK